MLSSQLHATTDVLPVAGLDRLAEHLPLAWIEQALKATGTASIRRRRLPAEQVVWLVIALALYRHQSMPEVLATLDLALPSSEESAVSKSAVTQARQRLGVAPMEDLFSQTASVWCAQDAERHAWKGLSLWAMDGTTFRVPDSAENRAHFGAQSYASGKVASYPQVRAVSITAIPTHLVADMAFGQYGQNEMLYAKTLVERIADHSLTIFDRGFLSAEILLGLSLAGEARHYLIPAKSNTKWELLSGTAEDGVVRMRVSPQARTQAPSLPEYWTARAIRIVSANGKVRVLLTSLLDRRRFKATDLAECYRRRWEIETSYRELKQSMLGTALTFRSQQPSGVEQEVWGALIAYNLVRLEMAKAAIQAKVEPTGLSFLRALHILQSEMIWAAGMAPGKLPAHLLRLRIQLQFAIVEKRRGRQCPRVVKALPNRYPAKYLKKDP
ncbi:IS4 family transposase [Dechloromonas sp. HYN0024]|uniref:IS4 family transposase n=1 Tax=Dechloromonas sp. HYN0024 TaxID=2231055 RepID=UPI000E4377B1|nr:IS4 family transposase [Dechloromonas sp. HYN0024]AXS79466.1 IS4 family transposase [Dechloromonas sp. HYN0024]AXS79677.1 IS4 family transposase [Dechloromonas sp. HYN0024]